MEHRHDKNLLIRQIRDLYKLGKHTAPQVRVLALQLERIRTDEVIEAIRRNTILKGE